MNKQLSIVALALAVLAPNVASAAAIDASLVPDGTYTVKVEKIIDSKHVQVAMDNGSETTFAGGRDSVDFTKVKAGDQIKCSVIKGQIMVYLDLSSH